MTTLVREEESEEEEEYESFEKNNTNNKNKEQGSEETEKKNEPVKKEKKKQNVTPIIYQKTLIDEEVEAPKIEENFNEQIQKDEINSIMENQNIVYNDENSFEHSQPMIMPIQNVNEEENVKSNLTKNSDISVEVKPIVKSDTIIDVYVPSTRVISCENEKVSYKDQYIKFQYVLFCSISGKVFAFDTSDYGKMNSSNPPLLWKNIISKGDMLSFIHFEPETESLYFIGYNILAKLNPLNGNIEWKKKMKGDLCKMIVLNEGIYTFSGTGRHFERFNKDTGKTTYYQKVKRKIFGASRPHFLVSKFRDVIYTLTTHSFCLFDRKKSTFKIINDKIKSKNISKLNEMIEIDEENILVAGTGMIALLNSRTGFVKREKKFYKYNPDAPLTFILRNPKLVIVAYMNKIYAFDTTTFNEHWVIDGSRVLYHIIIMSSGNGVVTPVPRGYQMMCLTQDDNYIYYSGGGKVGCINPKNGNYIWHIDLPNSKKYYASCLINIDRGVLFISETSTLYCINCADGTILFMNKFYENIGEIRKKRSHFLTSQITSQRPNLEHVGQGFLKANINQISV